MFSFREGIYILGFVFLVIFYGLYHGKPPSNDNFGRIYFTFSRHLKQIQVYSSRWWFQILFLRLPEEMMKFDKHIFQRG